MVAFCTEYSMQPAEVARAIEDRGLDAFYVIEHIHIPISKKSKYAGGSDYPKDFSYVYDPNVALTPAACATKRIRLGVKHAADLGFQDICALVPSAERGQVLETIDGFAALAGTLR
jgi:hypothetical protein